MGSTGWLYSAKQIFPLKVSNIFDRLGDNTQDVEINKALALKISDETKFDRREHRMSFYVREGFSLKNRTEGFCETLDVTSEMLNGLLLIDGWWEANLALGQTIKLEIGGPERMLSHLILKV